MQLSGARIRNFRSLRDVSVDFGSHTAFIGSNGTGKSSILKALERFYANPKTLDIDDFFGRDQENAVEIELTFSGLTDGELDVFHSRVRDGKLTVTRIFDTTSGSGRYFGLVPLHPEFAPIRALGAASPRRAAYNNLRTSSEKYSELPLCTSASQVDDAMLRWENDHPNELTLGQDDGQFFGFQNASRQALQRFTSFVFIPAVRDASTDAADAKSSAIGRLLEILVRSSILQRRDIVNFRDEVNTRYKELTSPENMPELAALAGSITTGLRELYSDAAVELSWRSAGDMLVPLPNADVTLSDDGFGGPVDRQGHGLQRAFIFTLLQQLARASMIVGGVNEPSSVEETEVPQHKTAPAPNLILAIEEPELYQHPTKQRHFSAVLRSLSNGTLPGTEGRTQVAFASHSPMFVSIPYVSEIRFVRRADCEGHKFKHCVLRALDLQVIAAKLEKALQKQAGSFSAASLAPKLHILGPELAEGFFADAVVLVEGRSDKAALSATAHLLQLNFESVGIAVLSVEGKANIDRPLLIFRELGIPTYPIWDCDTHKLEREQHPEQNLCLLRVSDPECDHKEPPRETRVTDRYAHFARTLEHTLKEDLSEDIFTACLEAACSIFDSPVSKDAQKSPEIMKALLRNASEMGRTSANLETIIRAIWRSLKGIELAP